MDKRVLQSSHASKTWEIRGEREALFRAAGSLERGSLSRLPCCHSSRMRMSAVAMIRPLHLSYRMRTSYRSRHPPRSPLSPSVSLRHSDLSLETKPERVPDLFVVSFQEEEVQRANTSPLFNGATGSSHELFIAAR